MKRIKFPENEYGQVDIRDGVPEPFVLIRHSYAVWACKKLAIGYSLAFTGFVWRNRHAEPAFGGIVVEGFYQEKVERLCAEHDEARAAKARRAKIRRAKAELAQLRQTAAKSVSAGEISKSKKRRTKDTIRSICSLYPELAGEKT